MTSRQFSGTGRFGPTLNGQITQACAFGGFGVRSDLGAVAATDTSGFTPGPGASPVP